MANHNSYYWLSRREGTFVAMEKFCDDFKLNFLSHSAQYFLFYKFFFWYSSSKLGRFLNKSKRVT